MDKILLGKDLEGEAIWLSKHTWDCSWYWGFGYLGNKDCHYHFDSLLDGKHFLIQEVFSSTKISQNNWYEILELFKQAYGLKEAYEIYYRGGAHITKTNRGVVSTPLMVEVLNNDLKKVLDGVWSYIEEILKGGIR
jgi:hypothetical protein